VDTFPVNLRLEERLCVIVGGGPVAERKVRSILRCTEQVTVVSPDVTPGIAELEGEGRVIHIREEYRAQHVREAFLVVATTGDPAANRAISRDARANGAIVNVVDSRDDSDFIMPSVLRRGSLTIAVGTDGKSPAMARSIRQELEGQYGEEYGRLLDVLEPLRPELKVRVKDSEERKAFFYSLLHGGVLDMLRDGASEQDIQRRVEEFTSSSLG
jgi:precorrin-2 dehydrogenase/sirohydrochlorin ferrochelatase